MIASSLISAQGESMPPASATATNSGDAFSSLLATVQKAHPPAGTAGESVWANRSYARDEKHTIAGAATPYIAAAVAAQPLRSVTAATATATATATTTATATATATATGTGTGTAAAGTAATPDIAAVVAAQFPQPVAAATAPGTAATPYTAAAAAAQTLQTAAAVTGIGSATGSSSSSSSSSTVTSGIAAASTAAALGASTMQALAASGTRPATATATAAATAAAAGTQGGGTAAQPNTVKPPLGSAELNARIAAGAPLLHSQPALTLATLSPAASQTATHGETNAEPAATPSSSSATGETATAKAEEPPPAIGAPAVTPRAPDTDTFATIVASAAASTASSAGNAANSPDAAASNAAVSASAAASGAAAASSAPSPVPLQTLAATPSTAPPTQTPLPFTPIADQVALTLKQAAADGSGNIKIQLKPESLGAIDVSLNVAHDGRVTAVITADRSDTLNMLKQDSSALQQSLRDAGLQADSSSLSFNLSSDSQPNLSQNTSEETTSNGSSGTSDDEPVIGTVTAAPTLRRHAGRVDIQV